MPGSNTTALGQLTLFCDLEPPLTLLVDSLLLYSILFPMVLFFALVPEAWVRLTVAACVSALYTIDFLEDGAGLQLLTLHVMPNTPVHLVLSTGSCLPLLGPEVIVAIEYGREFFLPNLVAVPFLLARLSANACTTELQKLTRNPVWDGSWNWVR
jgi:hypothetical protein